MNNCFAGRVELRGEFILITVSESYIYDFCPRHGGGPAAWLEQISRKSWATAKILAEVAKAMGMEHGHA